jgi:hypothetical protein
MRINIANRLATAAVHSIFAAGAFACTVNPPGTAKPALSATAPVALQAIRASSSERESDGGKSIVGLWSVNVYDDTGMVIDRAYESFFADGNELMVDTSIPATDNVCNGTWVKSGGTYKLKHPSFYFDLSGNLLGTAIIREVITLAKGGDAFQGTSMIDVYDLAGNLVFHGVSTVKATRITVD